MDRRTRVQTESTWLTAFGKASDTIGQGLGGVVRLLVGVHKVNKENFAKLLILFERPET